jgi:large subunit ribosomal protein L10
MENPRPEKVAVVDEVKARMSDAQAVLLTEYRGIDVASMSSLRRRLREAGGEYKVYKNTLVRFAARDLGLEIDELLIGPVALAIVPGDGGDPVTVAKALRDFAKENQALVIKGGVLGDKVLSAAEADALAQVAPREVLLAQLAGAMAAPMQQFAGLLQAVPRNFAYGLKALIDQGGAPGAPAPTAADTPADETPANEPPADETPSTEDAAAPAADPTPEPTDEAPDAPAEES